MERNAQEEARSVTPRNSRYLKPQAVGLCEVTEGKSMAQTEGGGPPWACHRLVSEQLAAEGQQEHGGIRGELQSAASQTPDVKSLHGRTFHVGFPVSLCVSPCYPWYFPVGGCFSALFPLWVKKREKHMQELNLSHGLLLHNYVLCIFFQWRDHVGIGSCNGMFIRVNSRLETSLGILSRKRI